MIDPPPLEPELLVLHCADRFGAMAFSHLPGESRDGDGRQDGDDRENDHYLDQRESLRITVLFHDRDPPFGMGVIIAR